MDPEVERLVSHPAALRVLEHVAVARRTSLENLSRATGVEEPRLSGILDRMREEGWIGQEAGPEPGGRIAFDLEHRNRLLEHQESLKNAAEEQRKKIAGAFTTSGEKVNLDVDSDLDHSELLELEEKIEEISDSPHLSREKLKGSIHSARQTRQALDNIDRVIGRFNK